jgi:hypothetical protein
MPQSCTAKTATIDKKKRSPVWQRSLGFRRQTDCIKKVIASSCDTWFFD